MRKEKVFLNRRSKSSSIANFNRCLLKSFGLISIESKLSFINSSSVQISANTKWANRYRNVCDINVIKKKIYGTTKTDTVFTTHKLSFFSTWNSPVIPTGHFILPPLMKFNKLKFHAQENFRDRNNMVPPEILDDYACKQVVLA